jgi:hypothetical protein
MTITEAEEVHRQAQAIVLPITGELAEVRGEIERHRAAIVAAGDNNDPHLHCQRVLAEQALPALRLRVAALEARQADATAAVQEAEREVRRLKVVALRAQLKPHIGKRQAALEKARQSEQAIAEIVDQAAAAGLPIGDLTTFRCLELFGTKDDDPYSRRVAAYHAAGML